MNRIFSKLLKALEENQDTVLSVITEEEGSTPRGAGSAMLVGREGHLAGTIGGGSVEYTSEQLSAELIEKKESYTKHFILAPNDKEDIGMVCGGNVTVYFQYIAGSDEEWKELAEKALKRYEERRACWFIMNFDGSIGSLVDENGSVIAGADLEIGKDALAKGCVTGDGYFSMYLPMGERAVIFGGGHCAQALAALLHTVGFRIAVMDNVGEFASRELYPFAEELITGDFTKLTDYLELKDDDYYVIMTNGHEFDLQVEEQLLGRKFSYIGCIGSKRKTATLNNKLKEEGFTDEQIARLHAPIGLKIKAVTPEEIAVSIAAEIICERALLREKESEETHGCPMH